MFELNGEYYSLEEIEQAAADSNVSVEDYIAEFSINKVEDVSLDKPEIEQLSSYVDELVGVSKQAKENEETSSLGTFVEAGLYTTGAFLNIPPQLEQAYYGAKASSIDWLKNVAGGDAADWLIGDAPDSAIAYIDPDTDEEIIFDNNPEKWKELSKKQRAGEEIVTKYSGTDIEVGELADKAMVKELEKFIDKEKDILETGKGFVPGVRGMLGQEGYEDAGVADVIGGTANFVSGVLSSLGPAVLTRGASLFPQIGGPMFADFNIEKAKNLYGDNEDALQRLTQNNETDFTTPAVLTVGAVAMERFGLRGITKYITKAPFKSRSAVGLLMTQNTEGITEWGQFGTEIMNIELARGKSKTEAAKIAWETMQTDQGLEAYLGGFIGAGIVGIGGRKINRALRNDKEGQLVVLNSLRELSNLKTQQSNASSKVVKNALDFEINRVEEQLRNYLKNNQNIAKQLTPVQKNELETLIDEKDLLRKQGNEILDKRNKNIISKKEAGYALRGINNQMKSIDKSIENIRKSIVDSKLEKDIEFAQEGAQNLGIEVQVLDTSTKPEDQQIIDEVFVDEKGKKVSGVEGAYDPKTNKIYIDKIEAAKKQKVTVGSHELLHGILANAAKIDNKILDQFKAQMSKDQIDLINNKLKENYSKEYIEQNPDEFITQFSDAIALGEITYNEGLFTKLMDVITPILRAVGFSNIKFDTGKDVYNFMRQYSKSIKEGKLSKDILSATQTRQTEGAKKFSKAETIDALVGPKIDGKYTISKTEWDNKSDQVIGDLYEGLQGLIKSKIPREKPPGFSQEDFISGTIAELIPHIRNFNPEQNNSLSGWINSQLQNKIGNVFKKGEAATKDVFEADVTEAKSVAVEDTPTPIQEKSIRSKLRRDLKIDKDLIDKVKQAVRKTFGTKLPEIESKEFKQALQKAYRTELKTPLAELLGTRENYKKFLEDNFESIYKALPQDILNKRFRQFAEDTGQREKTPEGKKIFKKRSIDKQEFVDYFLGPDVGTSTKGTRKDALAETLGEIMAIDATMEVIKEPEVKTKREDIAKLQDQKVTKTDEAKIALTLNVNPSLKFSKSNIDRIFGSKVLDPNNEKDRDLTFKVLTEIVPKFFPVTDVDGKLLIQSNYNWASAGSKESTRKKYRMMFLADPKRQGTSKYKGKNILEEALKNERKFSERERYILKIAAQAKTGFFTRKKNPIKFGSKEYFKLLNDNYDGLEYFLYQLQEMVKAYPETKPVVGALFNASSSSSGHIIRQSGMMRGVDKNFIKFEQNKKLDSKKYKTEKEHVWQQNQVGELMAWMVINGNVKKWMPFIKDNYYMLGLTAINNDKLKDTKGVFGSVFNYGNQQTPEFIEKLNEALKENNPDLTIESIIRYFNTKVNNNNDGFNSNELTFDGKPISEIYKVKVNKKYRNKETQAFQNQLILQQLLGEDINSQAEINEFLNIAPEKVKASEFNNNKLVPTVKFSKSLDYTNDNVLNKMAELDKEQSEAQMKFSKSQNLSDDFNKILENKTGIGADKVYSDVKAQVVGANKGKFNFFVPPSAEDFVGLLYKTLGKGKLGDAQMAWYKKNLLDPFARAMDNISRDRIALMNDFKALKKDLKIVPKNLKKKLPGEPFTQEQAVRTYIWNKQGMSPDGMSKADLKELTDFVESKPELVLFADQLIALQKGDKYPAPKFGWLAGNITTDLMDGINTIKRTKYLEQWQYNVDDIFTKANLNKLEAAYGKGYRTALEGILKRMRTGRNREFTSDSLTGRVTDWLTNSIGAIMFFNTRSAVLQTISAVNFINFKDNNIFAAGKAFANQPQFWKDFKTLFNSDFLVDRRNGLKLNVNEADIADMAKKGGVRGVISEMLRLGFLPTQIADSFAIASGGSSFYRNRVKKYTKEGMSKVEAEDKAFIDFREIAEEAQQSSRPDRISAQQAGPLGRIILAFANTPMQYTRLIKKAASDLKNGRGDTMTNISKIFYYGVAQNLLFNAMQQALFAMGFGDDEEETEKREEKYANIVNSMADSILRGAGIGGAIFSVLKNTGIKLAKEADKKSPKFQDVLTKEIAQLSPPVSSKLSKLRAAGRSYSWNKKEMMEKGFSLDNPAYLAAGQVIAATTNIPLDRAFKKIDNIRKASSSDYEAWARIAMLAGWSDWELGVKKSNEIEDNKITRKKSTRKTKRKQKTKRK